MTHQLPQLQPVGTRCVATVPASTSNLGPGFDCIGCAVALHNRFEYELLPEGSPQVVTVGGKRPAGIPTEPNNLALTTARDLMRRMGVPPPPMRLHADVDIPNARGLGSSSTAIVAGLVAGNALLGAPLSRHDVLDIAVEIEGHPDNVAPALLGGLVISAAHSHPLAWRRLPVHESVSFVFVVPDYEVRTADARGVLPATVPFSDAIFNSSRSPLVLLALQSGDLNGLWEMIEDKLHQPYRKPLFRAYDELAEAARAAGAEGFCVSGAGPTMLAICHHGARHAVIESLEVCLAEVGLSGTVVRIEPQNVGTTVELHRPVVLHS